MPVIKCQGVDLSAEKRKELIEKITVTAVEVTQTPSDFFTVIIQEFSDQNLGVNGESVSDIKPRLHG
jgi:4-oxalocrotonate tautomerase